MRTEKITKFTNSPFNSTKEKTPRVEKLYAHQIQTLIKLTPLMMLANVLNATAIYLYLGGRTGTQYLGYWVLSITGLAVVGLYHWYYSNSRKQVSSTSKSGLFKSARGATILALMWAILPLLFYPDGDYSTKLIIAAVTAGMLAGGVVSLYIVPPAMFSWIGVISTGSLLALFQSGNSEDYALIVLFAIYATALSKAGNSIASRYANSITTQYELSEQSETIDLLLRDFTENVSDWLWEIDAEGTLLRGDEKFEHHLALKFNSFNPKDYSVNQWDSSNVPSLNMRSLERVWDSFQQKKNFRDITIGTNNHESNRWVSVSGKPLFDSDGKFSGFRGVASDITDSKAAKERIIFLAHNDALTGLTNRCSFTKELESQVTRNDANQKWAVLYLDLDGFKSVNDRYSHATGDKLLTKVAARLRETVDKHDVVARLGGDEFAILCRSTGNYYALSALADKLINTISEPFQLADIKVEIGVSIGISIGLQDGSSGLTILNRADLALYRAKADGKGIARFYQREMDELIKERRMLERDLRESIHRGEISIAYQPLVIASNLNICGFEALARWKHPLKGWISPSDFIPIAESIGFISEIGDYIIRQSCREAANWPENIFLAINLSPRQFYSGKVVATIAETIETTGLDPARLELEITEGLFIQNTDSAVQTLHELKSMGISIAMDDFGTGYSSLSYLLKFPFDKIKIDRSLITSIGNCTTSRNVLETIIKLGKVLKLDITAEGVENADQLQVLQELDCTSLQGFLFGKPMLSSDLPAYFLQMLYPKLSGTTNTVPEIKSKPAA